MFRRTATSLAGAIGRSASGRFLNENKEIRKSVAWPDSKIAGHLKRQYQGKYSNEDAAKGTWRGMLRKDIRDFKSKGANFGIRSTTTAISLLCKFGSSNEASQLFFELLADLIKKKKLESLSPVTITAGAQALARSGGDGIAELRKLISLLESKNVIVPDNAKQLILRYYAKHDISRYKKVLQLYNGCQIDRLLQIQACRSLEEVSKVLEQGNPVITSEEFSALLFVSNCVTDVQKLWDTYVTRLTCQPNVYHFNSVLSVCRRSADFESLQRWLQKMQSANIKADPYTFSISIMCCAECTSAVTDLSFTLGSLLFERAIQNGLADNSKVCGAAAFLFSTSKDVNGLKRVMNYMRTTGLRVSPIMQKYFDTINDIENPMVSIEELRSQN